YSPVVHRLLQLAANMYEATVLTNANYPSMFQPYFGMHSNQVVIKGYRPVVLPTLQQLTNTPPFPIDLNEFNDPDDRANYINGNGMAAQIYGVPWIIAARK